MRRLAAVAVVLALGSSTAHDAHPLAAATVVVVLVLHGTAPLVYESARYAWTFKHIGLADYFAQYHDNDRAAVDIYHAFPAFFAALGVVDGTSTARGLEVVARWWPLFVELGSVLVIRRLILSICRDERVSWVAALLFVTTNWIGQDYLSPQSVSLVLALTIHAIVFRQLDDGRASPGQAAGGRLRRHEIVPIVAIVTCWTAIVVTHPLTPFMVLPGLFVAFPIFRFRPRWLPLLLAAIALGYAYLQRGIIGGQGVGRDVGNVVTNVQGRGTTSGVVASRVSEFSYYFAAALALSTMLVALSVLGTPTLVRSVGRRRFVGICCLAISPTLFLAVDSYGQEGVLRAFLFASPWLCLSAAMLLVKIRGRIRLRRHLGGSSMPRVLVATLVGASAVLACIALFVRDEQFAVSASDVEVVRRFEELEPNGALLIGTGVLPERVTAQYFRQRYVVLGTPERFADGTIDAWATLGLIGDEIEAHDGPVYMAFGPSLTNRTVFDGRAIGCRSRGAAASRRGRRRLGAGVPRGSEHALPLGGSMTPAPAMSRAAPQVLLVNHWHDDNIGDSAITTVTMALMRRHWPECAITLVSMLGSGDEAFARAFRHTGGSQPDVTTRPSLVDALPSTGRLRVTRLARWALSVAGAGVATAIGRPPPRLCRGDRQKRPRRARRGQQPVRHGSPPTARHASAAAVPAAGVRRPSTGDAVCAGRPHARAGRHAPRSSSAALGAARRIARGRPRAPFDRVRRGWARPLRDGRPIAVRPRCRVRARTSGNAAGG